MAQKQSSLVSFWKKLFAQQKGTISTEKQTSPIYYAGTEKENRF